MTGGAVFNQNGADVLVEADCFSVKYPKHGQRQPNVDGDFRGQHVLKVIPSILDDLSFQCNEYVVIEGEKFSRFVV